MNPEIIASILQRGQHSTELAPIPHPNPTIFSIVESEHQLEI
jgi:hypothetical protein